MVNKIDTAIIVAGGLGTRLRPLTYETPKPLLPIHGKPIIEHAIENLKKHGVKKIILSIGYKAEQIQKYFQDGSRWEVEISYSIESEPLGTGGAVKLASSGLNQPFFLTWGDNLMNINFSQMREKYLQNKNSLIMTLTPREDVENFGVAKLNGEKIINFVEKPARKEAPSNLINAGAFIVDPKCLDILPPGFSSIERDCFEKLAPLGKISSFTHEGQWFPTDTLEKYNHANSNFQPEIDFSKKKIIIADVDDTICESCQQISLEMAKQISFMIKKGYEFAFISGTKSADLIKMISSLIKEKHHILGTTGTNYTLVENNKYEEKYNLTFNEEEKKEILTALEKLIYEYNIQSMTTKEDQLQDRESQITLSAIGRNAPSEIKKKYDPEGKIRTTWVNFLRNYLSEERYDIRIGGTTSVDITRKGLDKEWGIRNFAKHNEIKLENILFFGDKIHPGGNDFPATKIVDCIKVKSPKETLKKIQEIFPGNKQEFLIVNKPWGKFEQFTHNENSTVKILTVIPKKRLSLQSHENREEMWVALDDGVIAEIDGNKHHLNKGQTILIPKKSKHRLSSKNKEVRVLEISYGQFDEEDIIRYEDDFDRI